MSVFGAYYVTNPNNCPVSYQSQTCSGSDVVCGASGGITFCSLPSSITAPTSAGSTSTSNYACSDTACDGGFVIDCYGYDGASPFCDTSLCDRESTCYNKHVQTICTANLYVDSSCSASCISGYVACDGLSGTELTCYPNAEDGKGYKRCSSLWKPIDRSDLVYAEQTVKLELKAGGVIECEVVDGFVGQDCYFNRREAFRSEFE